MTSVHRMQCSIAGKRSALVEACRGLASRFRPAGELSPVAVQDYFEGRSNGSLDAQRDVTAAMSPPYVELMRSSGLFGHISDAEAGAIVLDFGCGNGALVRRLFRDVNSECSYVGYDINTVQIELLQSLFSNEPRLQFLSASPPQADVQILCNVLPYVEELGLVAVGEDIRSSAAAGSKLFVIEPSPRWPWEKNFSGLTLEIRSIATLTAVVEGWGFEIERIDQVTYSKVGDRYFGPIANCLTARRKHDINQ